MYSAPTYFRPGFLRTLFPSTFALKVSAETRGRRSDITMLLILAATDKNNPRVLQVGVTNIAKHVVSVRTSPSDFYSSLCVNLSSLPLRPLPQASHKSPHPSVKLKTSHVRSNTTLPARSYSSSDFTHRFSLAEVLVAPSSSR